MNQSSAIKKVVREKYAEVARKQQTCCEPAAINCCEGTEQLQFVDYADLREQGVPDADLGLGCGTPTLWAELQPGERVVDLGSGAGIDVFLAARAVGPSGLVVGLDMTPEMLALARQNANRHGFSNVRFIRADLDAIPIADGSVDVVLSNCVINLVPDKSHIYRQIQRLLRGGGRFVISDMVTIGTLPDDVREDPVLWAGCVAGALDQDAYLAIIAEAGFSDIAIVASVEHDLPSREGIAGTFTIASVTITGRKP